MAACAGDDEQQDTTQTISPERKRADAAVLDSLLEAERTAVVAYRAVGVALGPGSAGRRAAATFLEHESAHARALERGLAELGSSPSRPRPDRQYAAGFPPLRSDEDALRFALDVEDTQIAAYGDSLASLFTPELRVTVATILATQAEHMAVLLGELDEPQAPKAFVVGKPPDEEQR